MNKLYAKFIETYEAQGFEFPCTAQQFSARATEFAKGDEALIDAMCQQGIGPDWRDA